MASDDDIKKTWPAIQEVSCSILNQLGPKLSNTPSGHIQTDIAATASLAGLIILQETVPNSKLLEFSKCNSHDFILSDSHKSQKDTRRFMAGAAPGVGLDPSGGWNDPIPQEHNPLMGCRDMTKYLAPPFYAACRNARLEREYYKFAAAYTGVCLVGAGLKLAILDPTIGKALLCYYLNVGSKTVPYAEALWES